MKIRIFRMVVLLFLTIIWSGCVTTATTNIKTESGDVITAIYRAPVGKGKFPVVIYNHGTFVRKLGYSEAADRGYDVNDFIKALNREGFAAIAPIRKAGRLATISGRKADIMGGTTSEWNSAVVEGLEILNIALEFLKDQPYVDRERIGIIGFSEGGNIALWSALEQKDFKAVVLMSPANLGKSDEYYFSRIIPVIDKVSAPVFLTLGDSDLGIILRNCQFDLIPAMEQLNKEFEYRIDYPGNHEWFWEVRAEYWNDVIAFLNRKLK